MLTTSVFLDLYGGNPRNVCPKRRGRVRKAAGRGSLTVPSSTPSGTYFGVAANGRLSIAIDTDGEFRWRLPGTLFGPFLSPGRPGFAPLRPFPTDSPAVSRLVRSLLQR